jgi:drug/metabolite transporter (DMT)-like permease
MKTVGLILIVIGVLMIVIRGFNVPVKKNIVNVGPVEINKTEDKWIGWPTYAGAIIAVAGIVLIITNRKKSS